MTDFTLESTKLADDILADQAAWRRRQLPRYQEIMNAAEAIGREKLAFALALRFDLRADRVIALLSVAPVDLQAIEDICAWVDSIPRQTEPETVQ